MRILIANRGEIACRLVQACHELDHEAIAIYSHADRHARHVQLADEAVEVASYLNVDAVVEAARRAGAAGIHPGYGFLSENPELAEACQAAGVVFIGPPAGVIRLMGDKMAAKRLAAEAGLPLIPGSELQHASQVGFPLLIKAAAGGGGKGMRSVASEAEFAAAFESAKREALAAFGDDRVFLERLITHGRHMEVQIVGDTYGQVVHFGERDCSIQRRYQKVVEEAPAPGLDDDLRRRLHASAVDLARAAGYVGPGTVEFLVEGEDYYFLEMNTRLQVEHPVTELVCGIDLAKLQIEVAFGGSLASTVYRLPSTPIGHAIEARVYAEDPAAGFLPATGVIRRLELPQGPGIRNDAGIQPGDEVGIGFDPLLAKLIVWGADRPEALARLRDALRRYCILGLTTNLGFQLQIAEQPDFAAAKLSTRFIDEHPPRAGGPDSDLAEAAHAWEGLRRSSDPFRQRLPLPAGAELLPDGGLMLHGRRYYLAEDERQVEVWRDGRRAVLPKLQPPSVEAAARGQAATEGEQSIVAPLTGMVVKVLAGEGEAVAAHQTLVVMEAMKMEHNVQAPFAATVARVHVKAGALATAGSPMVDLLPKLA
ncbi:MAG TPA: biotin carboxylase N-terminal domain-containing protein [Chloroflexota bacterium]